MRRFLSWFKKASSARTAARRASPLRRVSFRLEALEDRLVPAPIVWTNRLTATDTLTAAERAVVDAAIRTWQDIIVDFDSNPNNGVGSFNVSISGGSTSGLDLGGSTGASTDQYAANSAGTPTSARIRIDAGAGGAGTWYIDPNPNDNAEFTNVRTLLAANGGPAGADLYSTVLHELGQEVVDGLLGPALAAAKLHERGVDDDAVQPGRQSRTAMEVVNAAEGGEKRILQGVLGICE